MNIIDNLNNKNFFPIDKPTNKFWYDQDTKERYTHNLKVQPEDWNYRNKIVYYFTNSFGYRTKQFKDIDWRKCIVLFGCSYVYGVGSAEDETISGCLEQITGIPVINMGAPGSSPVFSLHNSAILSAKYPNPKAVVYGWSSQYRCPFYTKSEVTHCGNWLKDPKKMGESWNSNEEHPAVNLKMSSIISKEMWNNRTNYYEFTFFKTVADTLNCDYIKQVDYARDLGHSGKESNKIAAETIAKNLNL